MEQQKVYLLTPDQIAEQWRCVIPALQLMSLMEYVNTGRPTGGYLEAVIANDLVDAVARADAGNLIALKATALAIYNSAPSACRGSRDAYKNWIKCGGLKGIGKQS